MILWLGRLEDTVSGIVLRERLANCPAEKARNLITESRVADHARGELSTYCQGSHTEMHTT